MKKKILWYSDSPFVETGFAQVAKQILMALYNTALYDIEVVPTANKTTWYDQKKFPLKIHTPSYNPKDPYNMGLLLECIEKSDYDILFTFNDLGVVNMATKEIVKARTKKKFKWINYSPIDCDMYFLTMYDAYTLADIAVTYTKYGFDTAIRNEPLLRRKLKVIGHGCEPEVFKPLPVEQIREYRAKEYNASDTDKIILNVNRNQWRKDLKSSMKVFDILAETDPNIKLHLHALKSVGDSPVPLTYNIKHKNRIKFADRKLDGDIGVTREEMNLMYNAADVVISTSVAEGWGLSTTEAFAAGTPVIVPNNTSFTELIGEGNERGVLAPVVDQSVVYYSNDFADRWPVNVKEMAKLVREVLDDSGEESKTFERAAAARKYAEENNWETINKQWIDLFAQL